MFISKELESSLLESVVGLVKELDLAVSNDKLAVLCISPDYSSIVGLRVLHALSKDGELPHYVFVDVAYPDDSEEKKEQYKKVVQIMAPYFKKTVDKVILVEAVVLTGNNYKWIQEELVKAGFLKEDILTVALLELKDSIFKCDIVGQYVDEIPEFYWEEENNHWK